MKAKDPLTGTQAAGSFLLYHRKGQKGLSSYPQFLAISNSSNSQFTTRRKAVWGSVKKFFRERMVVQLPS